MLECVDRSKIQFCLNERRFGCHMHLRIESICVQSNREFQRWQRGVPCGEHNRVLKMTMAEYRKIRQVHIGTTTTTAVPDTIGRGSSKLRADLYARKKEKATCILTWSLLLVSVINAAVHNQDLRTVTLIGLSLNTTGCTTIFIAAPAASRAFAKTKSHTAPTNRFGLPDLTHTLPRSHGCEWSAPAERRTFREIS